MLYSLLLAPFLQLAAQASAVTGVVSALSQATITTSFTSEPTQDPSIFATLPSTCADVASEMVACGIDLRWCIVWDTFIAPGRMSAPLCSSQQSTFSVVTQTNGIVQYGSVNVTYVPDNYFFTSTESGSASMPTVAATTTDTEPVSTTAISSSAATTTVTQAVSTTATSLSAASQTTGAAVRHAGLEVGWAGVVVVGVVQIVTYWV